MCAGSNVCSVSVGRLVLWGVVGIGGVGWLQVPQVGLTSPVFTVSVLGSLCCAPKPHIRCRAACTPWKSSISTPHTPSPHSLQLPLCRIICSNWINPTAPPPAAGLEMCHCYGGDTEPQRHQHGRAAAGEDPPKPAQLCPKGVWDSQWGSTARSACRTGLRPGLWLHSAFTAVSLLFTLRRNK